MENLRTDIVPGTNFKIIQDKSKFSYGIDAILLSDFAKPKGLVMDLGTGTGIIPIRMAEKKWDFKKNLWSGDSRRCI